MANKVNDSITCDFCQVSLNSAEIAECMRRGYYREFFTPMWFCGKASCRRKAEKKYNSPSKDALAHMTPEQQKKYFSNKAKEAQIKAKKYKGWKVFNDRQKKIRAKMHKAIGNKDPKAFCCLTKDFAESVSEFLNKNSGEDLHKSDYFLLYGILEENILCDYVPRLIEDFVKSFDMYGGVLRALTTQHNDEELSQALIELHQKTYDILVDEAREALGKNLIAGFYWTVKHPDDYPRTIPQNHPLYDYLKPYMHFSHRELLTRDLQRAKRLQAVTANQPPAKSKTDSPVKNFNDLLAEM